jgi:RimJ/RimL family protein N-acetyltransferase
MSRTTPRLELFPITTEHVDDLVRLHSDPDVAAWHGGPWSHERATEFAASNMVRQQRDGASKWIAYEQTTGDLVGRGGLSQTVIADKPCWEVGWTLRRPYWGHGYATEIGREGVVVALDELGADEVVAFTEPHNARSRAVMERLGMNLVGEIDHVGEHFVLYRTDRHP